MHLVSPLKIGSHGSKTNSVWPRSWLTGRSGYLSCGAGYEVAQCCCAASHARQTEIDMALPATKASCRIAKPEDFPALEQMLELYQYELSDIWDQDLDTNGRYGYDLSRHREGHRFHAHVALENGRYVGFALVAPAAVTRTEGSW